MFWIFWWHVSSFVFKRLVSVYWSWTIWIQEYINLPRGGIIAISEQSKGTLGTYFVGYIFSVNNVWGPSYLGLTRSISLLLMPWLLASPGHQQPWYWLCRLDRSLSYLRKDFNDLCHINVEEWHKMYIYVMFPLKNLARKGYQLNLISHKGAISCCLPQQPSITYITMSTSDPILRTRILCREPWYFA